MKHQINTIRKALELGAGAPEALAALAEIERMAGEQEPVAWQRRIRPTWGNGKAPWGPWEECSEGQVKNCWKTPLLNEWAYEARALYAAAPPAQQPQAEAVPSDVVRDVERLDWLSQHEGRYYNIDRISSIVGTGFLTGPLDDQQQKHATLRAAIDAAMAQGEKP